MKILLATDGSEYSEGAAGFLRCLNLSLRDEITVFHALYWIPFLYDKDSYYGTLKEIKQEIAPRIIDSVLKLLTPVNAKISTAIVEGPPEECIINAATDAEADMIVMGARGIRGMKSLFIGSVTRAVSIRSPKPVLVTRLPSPASPDRLRILFATDGSDHSVATREFLCRLPFHERTEITVMHVMPADFLDIPETFAPLIIKKMIEMNDKIRAVQLAESQKIIEQSREYFSTRFRHVDALSATGDPSAEIVNMAAASGTALIAMGCRGLKGIRGMMGSVSRNILAHSPCSVLIGKTCQASYQKKNKE
jgi:nucleotide-binding universal stress UspA family protein